MKQLVKSLSHKCKNLSSDLQNPFENLGTMTCACNPRDGKIGSGDRQIPAGSQTG